MNNLAAILSAGGLDVAILTFTVHVKNCGHFFFEYDGTAADPFIIAESESPEEMCENAMLVSASLATAGVRHRFEVLDLDGNRVAYLHHEWPMPSNTSCMDSSGK